MTPSMEPSDDPAKSDEPDNSIPIRGLVLVHVKQQYGQTVYEPANLLAHALAGLAATKNLNRASFMFIKTMGLTIRSTDTPPKDL